MIQALQDADSAGVFRYEKPGNVWEPSDLYTWSDMTTAVHKMATAGVGKLKLWAGGDNHVYGLVNVAAFLAQVMQETIPEKQWPFVSDPVLLRFSAPRAVSVPWMLVDAWQCSPRDTARWGACCAPIPYEPAVRSQVVSSVPPARSGRSLRGWRREAGATQDLETKGYTASLTVRYNACDENNWSDLATMTGDSNVLEGAIYPATSACGQLHQSYQHYQCSAEEDALAGGQMACDVDPDIKRDGRKRAGS